jgi:SAM-dependent methyltransferase
MPGERSNHEVWADGDSYEPYIGRWSRLVAREFLNWLALPKGAGWLDVGCGTGALSETILLLCDPRQVKGIDRSEGYIEYIRNRLTDPRAEFHVGDAQTLPVETGTCDAVVSGLVLNFVPQPGEMVSEMSRTARKGGVVALFVWDYAGRMQLMRHFWNAAAALDPSAVDLDEGRRFPICHPARLSDLFRGAGLHRVETRAIDIPTDFKDFDDYWSPFLGGQGPASGYVMSLSGEQRSQLKESLRASLPTALDGSIPLVARAWAVRSAK